MATSHSNSKSNRTTFIPPPTVPRCSSTTVFGGGWQSPDIIERATAITQIRLPERRSRFLRKISCAGSERQSVGGVPGMLLYLDGSPVINSVQSSHPFVPRATFTDELERKFIRFLLRWKQMNHWMDLLEDQRQHTECWYYQCKNANSDNTD